ncbi:hypothetical protein KPL78_23315 [Roseomonas sp. HJA6]|uniref:Uncharacterized protein n=1 Tax=Roseomonas alba TaxID=2846776 RepID=A0ABS7AES7_9PROT|nr:hypothetical protein [Neoroseomonas alba]MBW6400810.1 hypothetical protein [Neoroseomonas alba]
MNSPLLGRDFRFVIPMNPDRRLASWRHLLETSAAKGREAFGNHHSAPRTKGAVTLPEAG